MLVICWSRLFGAYSLRLVFDWGLPDGCDAADFALQVCEHPNVWTDGSLVLDEVSGVSSSGSGFFSHLPGQGGVLVGGVISLVCVVESCGGFCSVPGPLQTVQRAEFWGERVGYSCPTGFHGFGIAVPALLSC